MTSQVKPTHKVKSRRWKSTAILLLHNQVENKNPQVLNIHDRVHYSTNQIRGTVNNRNEAALHRLRVYKLAHQLVRHSRWWLQHWCRISRNSFRQIHDQCLYFSKQWLLSLYLAVSKVELRGKLVTSWVGGVLFKG